jgi:MFS superfamily sulfate permease-like transporter
LLTGRISRAKWHVEDYVKKVAFCRLNNPLPFGFAIRVANRLKSLITRTPRSLRLN